MATTKKGIDVIKKFMEYLDQTTDSGKTALDKAVTYASDGHFKNYTAALNQMISECKSLGADKFLAQKCGINLNNTDTGAITGYDAGGSEVKTADSIVPESGKLDTSFNATSFETNGLTFHLSKTKLSKNEAYMWRALKTWWAAESLKLIKESYGYSFNDTDVTVKDIIVEFKNETSRKYFAYVYCPKKTTGNYSLTLAINKAYFSSFKSSDVNGVSSKDSKNYLDRIIAHELTHAIMMAKVNNYADLPPFVTEGLGELTRGIDDLKKNSIKTLAKAPAKLKSSLNATTSGSTNAYAAGYIFFRWLAKQGAQDYLSDTNLVEKSSMVTVKGSVLTVSKDYSFDTLDLAEFSSTVKNVNAKSLSKDIIILGNSSANSILSGSGNDSLKGNAGNDKLFGNDGNDTISGDDGKDTLSGGNGNDILYGGKGNDSLKGDAGNDKLFGEDGNDIISGDDGKDTLSGGNGNDTLYGGKGNDSLKGNAGNDKLFGEDGNDIISGDDGKDTLSGGNGNDILYGGKGNDSLKGNFGNDELFGEDGNDKISGDDGNDILYGGKGNDSLWGDAGADEFIYSSGDGKDIIFGFDNNDTLTLDGLDFKASYKNNAIIFTVDEGSITLKKFTATTFHINDDIYKISGSKLVKK